MPYASDAQRRYFHFAEKAGKIKKSTVDEFDKASKGMDLPEKKMAMGGQVECPKCGHGFDMGGEVPESGDDDATDWTVENKEPLKAPLAMMLRKNRKHMREEDEE